MTPEIREQDQVSNYFVFFIIISGQIGTAVLGFQRIIMKEAGYDAWLTVLLGGIIIHLLLYCTLQVLKRGNGDIIYIHQQLFGKWIGNTISFGLITYALFGAITVFRTYVEVIQVWMFPRLDTTVFAAVFLLLVYYVASAGFRIIVGVCLISFLTLLLILPIFLFPLQFAEFQNMLPIAKHSISEILNGTKGLTLSFLGFESILLYYPFLKRNKSSHRWAHLGASMTMLIYLYITIISFSFYSEGQLSRTIWATLSLFKIVQMPFVERFEYIGVSLWALIVLPNIALSIWICSYGLKRLVNVKVNLGLVISIIIILLISTFITSRANVNMLNDIMAKIGFYVLVFYIPTIYLFQSIKSMLQRGSKNEEAS